MNKEYKIKLDLNKKLYNKKLTFNQFDENVNDFYIEITKNNEIVKDLDKSMITLASIKPNGEVDAQFVEVKDGVTYASLKPSMCDLVGNYQAKAMIVLGDKIITTDTINYSVSEDKIVSKLNEDVVTNEKYSVLTDTLIRLSEIEISEEERIINEAERILAEENRKTEEAKRVETELNRVHEEADRAKYDATREGNENIRKLNEDLRKSNENIRLENEAKRVEEENKRKLAEEERSANYNFMTEDEERRRLEANAHKEAETLRVQAENNRANEEAKRRTTEQARVSAENTRVSNENTRKSNETTRQNNETQRVNAETQRQTRYNTFIVNAESNANNFEGYVKNAKANEEERKSNELDRKAQENRRASNETERMSNENSRKVNEVVREKNETNRQSIFTDKVNKVDNKIYEIENRFNNLTSKQQQDAEVIDARYSPNDTEEHPTLGHRLNHMDNKFQDIRSQLEHIKNSEVKIIGVETSEGGDCTILIFPNGETMMIDCLVASEASKITNVLSNNNINKIDYVLITHYHIDHCGSIDLLSSYFDNKTVFFLPQVLRDTLDSGILKNETLVINTAKNKKCQIVRPNESQVVEIEDVKLTFLNTEHSRYYDDEVFNYNNLSVSLLVEYGTQRLFLSGDVATTAQEYLEDKIGKVNIYKAHHHASDFFQSSSYLLSLKPEIIYGCCGSGQYATLVYVRAFTDLVTQYGIPFYPTSINGNVEISMRMNESLIKGYKSVESYSHISTIETLLKTKILDEDFTKYTLKDITDAIPFQTTFDFMVDISQFPNVLPEAFKSNAYSFRGKKSHNGWFIIEVTDLVTLHEPSYIHVINGIPYFLNNLKMTLETGNTTNANTHTVKYNNGYARDVVVDGNTIQGISYYNDIEVCLKVVNRNNGVVSCSVFGKDINFYHNASGTDAIMWYTFKMLNVPFSFANNYDIFINKTAGATINATISIKRTRN